MPPKILYIIAGPNGAGKTTASMSILPGVLHCKEFVNADNIARGISPLNPEDDIVSIAAGKLMMQRVRVLLEGNENFAIETTLATRSHAALVKEAHDHGFYVVLLFFYLDSPDISVRRVAQRVQEGGHNIPRETIFRRYEKGLQNFNELFKPVVDTWMLYNGSDVEKVLMDAGGDNEELRLRIHEGLIEAQHEMLRQKAERNETLIRVDINGHCYDQSARSALSEVYNETAGGPQPTPHPTNPFDFQMEYINPH